MTSIGTKCGRKCRAPSQTQAHCSVCHVTFGSVALFDSHRKSGGTPSRFTGECRTPRAMKLKQAYGVWDTPEHGAAVRKRVEAMHAARDAAPTPPRKPVAAKRGKPGRVVTPKRTRRTQA